MAGRPSWESLRSVVNFRVQQGLELLRQARLYAETVQRPAADFAVEIATFRAAGLTASDLRWLMCAGCAEHFQDVTMIGEPGRRTRKTESLSFNDASCFVLTSVGLELAEGLMAGQAFTINHVQIKPVWNPATRELLVGSAVVKQFRVPAPNQERILSAFQEEGWPRRIDDPLPPSDGIDAKDRLHTAIRSLNRNQKARLIRFHGDGIGEGIGWQLAETDGELRRLLPQHESERSSPELLAD